MANSISNPRISCLRAVLAAGLALLWPGLQSIAQDAPASRSSSSVKKPAAKARRNAKSSLKRRRVAHRSRPVSYRRRLAQLRPEPKRIAEIQQALIQAGYLHHEASGNWDDTTRDAMRRYQEERGFPATGLPEAKSLMKLGLGPHPLPRDVEPGGAAQAGVNAAPVTSASPASAAPLSNTDPTRKE